MKMAVYRWRKPSCSLFPTLDDLQVQFVYFSRYSEAVCLLVYWLFVCLVLWLFVCAAWPGPINGSKDWLIVDANVNCFFCKTLPSFHLPRQIALYGSFSPGRGKWAKCVIIFLKLYCDQTVWFCQVFSTVLKRLCLLESKNTFVLVLAIFLIKKSNLTAHRAQRFSLHTVPHLDPQFSSVYFV